jgi:hypothetical protein
MTVLENCQGGHMPAGVCPSAFRQQAVGNPLLLQTVDSSYSPGSRSRDASHSDGAIRIGPIPSTAAPSVLADWQHAPTRKRRRRTRFRTSMPLAHCSHRVEVRAAPGHCCCRTNPAALAADVRPPADRSLSCVRTGRANACSLPRPRCHSTDVLHLGVGARFADSGLRGFLTAVGHAVTATERHGPSTTLQSARGIWGESASAWVPPEAPRTGPSFNRALQFVSAILTRWHWIGSHGCQWIGVFGRRVRPAS